MKALATYQELVAKVDAKFENGVLTVEVAKAEKAKPKKIQVKAAK